MIIKADRKLFVRWINLSKRIRHMAAIVQNNMEISQDDFEEQQQLVLDIKNDLKQLWFDTVKHVEEEE